MAMQARTQACDVAVVGAGPAGLAAACALRLGGIDVVLIESGKTVDARDRYVASDVTHGVGGAGLYSDGKFSFFPSATELWTLADGDALMGAYEWAASRLRAQGMQVPPFPKNGDAPAGADACWTLKEYPSYYLSLEARHDLVGQLAKEAAAETSTLSDLVGLNHVEEEERIRLDVDRGDRADIVSLTCKQVVLATGRFGALDLARIGGVGGEIFRRLEVGVRIEQPSGKAFFRSVEQLDPKFRFKDLGRDLEWRTFCACRDGETILTDTAGLWTVSGRADCPPTGRSNIGFNTRILDPIVAQNVLDRVIGGVTQPQAFFDVGLLNLLQVEEAALAAVDRAFGCEVRSYVTMGLERLAERFPEMLDAETRLIGPTVEGTGWYPALDDDLRHLKLPLWVAGDASGRFRGIVAAMVSGHYVGQKILERFRVAGAG